MAKKEIENTLNDIDNDKKTLHYTRRINVKTTHRKGTIRTGGGTVVQKRNPLMIVNVSM